MTAEPPNGAAPPAFATAPWGYKRAEVDSWASWVAALVAHGRNETVRADSAEATLKATLQRLEQLHRGPSSAGSAEASAPTDPAAGAPEAADTTSDAPEGGGTRTGGRTSATVSALPRRIPPPTDTTSDPAGEPSAGPDDTRDRPELARLQVVERTLHEVMTLLHRLAGPERP